MIKIRTPEAIDTSVWITSLKTRLPSDHSWVTLPVMYWTGDDEGTADLYEAFDRGLIEVSVEDQDIFPSWYLDVLAPNVRVPEEILEEAEDFIVEYLAEFRRGAHSAIWTIVRKGLYAREMERDQRESVIRLLQSDIGQESGD